MNKTTLYLGTAGALALLALVVGLPRVTQFVQPPVHPPVGPTLPVGPAVSTGGSIRMTGRLSHPYVPVGRSDVFVTVDLSGVEVPGAERSPLNLAIVVDRSGSMAGYKLMQAKQAATQLVGQLRPADRLAIVHYGSDVKELASLEATELNKDRMREYIATNIWDDGGTNIGAALAAGRTALARHLVDFRVNRLILVSDGQPTEGMTDAEGITSLVSELRRSGITVSSIGVGNDFNEDLMQAIAERGSGAYGYLQDAAQLAALFQKDFTQAGRTIARNVELSFELPPGTELAEVLGYSAVREGNRVKVALTDFSSGQTERVVARLQISPTGVGSAFDVTGLRLDYADLLQDGRRVESAVRLAAMATQDAKEILARRDKEATVFAARAQSAWNLSQAANHLRQGRRDEAKALVQQNQVLFDEAAGVAGTAAVAPDQKAQAEIYLQYEQANDSESVERAVKGSKKKARIDYGLMGSTY